MLSQKRQCVCSFVSSIVNKSQFSQGIYGMRERALRQSKNACNPRDFPAIDFQMLSPFRTARVKDGVSSATVNKHLRTLQSALERGVPRGYIRENPFHGNRKQLWVREPEPTPRILEPEDFAALLDACHDDRWRAICVVGYYPSLRRGEMLAMESKDVDFENRMLHVRNKDEQQQRVAKTGPSP